MCNALLEKIKLDDRLIFVTRCNLLHLPYKCIYTTFGLHFLGSGTRKLIIKRRT